MYIRDKCLDFDSQLFIGVYISMMRKVDRKLTLGVYDSFYNSIRWIKKEQDECPVLVNYFSSSFACSALAITSHGSTFIVERSNK